MNMNRSNFVFAKLLGILFLSLYAVSCVSQNPNRITILSYNIHYGVGTDGERDLHRIAELINQFKPDLVGLQEVSDSSQTAKLAELTKMEGIFGPSTEIEPPNLYELLGIPVPEAQLYYGDAILSKYPFTYIGNLSLPSASSSRYEAMCIELQIPGIDEQDSKLRFITTHFDYLSTIGSDLAREASVDVIEKAFVDDSINMSYVLTGDLNATPGSRPLQLLEEKGWMQENQGKSLFTVPVRIPQKQIDYILPRPREKWEIIEVKVIDEKMASDHLPILMTLEFKPK